MTQRSERETDYRRGAKGQQESIPSAGRMEICSGCGHTAGAHAYPDDGRLIVRCFVRVRMPMSRPPVECGCKKFEVRE